MKAVTCCASAVSGFCVNHRFHASVILQLARLFLIMHDCYVEGYGPCLSMPSRELPTLSTRRLSGAGAGIPDIQPLSFISTRSSTISLEARVCIPASTAVVTATWRIRDVQERQYIKQMPKQLLRRNRHANVCLWNQPCAQLNLKLLLRIKERMKQVH